MPDTSSPPSFNLIEERWLPVTSLAAEPRLASLRELLREPAAYRGLSTTVPTEFLALHRLLLAICHRAIGPGDLYQRSNLLQAWPSHQIMAYLDRWSERFDLFHPDRPFMQIAALRGVDSLSPKPWTNLAFDRSSGNTKLLFDHSMDDAPGSIDPVQAAQVLLAHLQFVPGGLVKALRTSGTRGAACAFQVVMPLGRNLQETLALSLCPQAKSEHAQDLPPWETEPPEIATLHAPPEMVALGPAQRYTWLSRAVLLQPGTDGTVSSALYAEGLELSESPVPDPMVAMVTGKDAALHPLYLDVDRAFWRDLYALSGESGSTPPRVIASAIELRAMQDDYSPLELATGGLLPDKAKIVLWRLEERRVSPVLLQAEGVVASRMDAAIQRAQQVGQSLYGALTDLCREWLAQGADRQPAPADVKALMRQLDGLSRYWAGLESRFWALADRLGQGEDPDRCLLDWHLDVRDSARDCWQVVSELLGRDGRSLAAQAKAAPLLRFTLKKALEN